VASMWPVAAGISNAERCSLPPSGAKCEYLIVMLSVACPSHVCTRRMGAPPPVRMLA
jgi:hypothetical protein